jgi:hypothetical protein
MWTIEQVQISSNHRTDVL